MRALYVVAGTLFMFLIACQSANPQGQEQLKHLGVYAQMASGSTVEITSYGTAEVQDSISDGMSIVFIFTEAVPPTGRATAFFLNLPNAAIEESQIFILPDPKLARFFVDKNKKSPSPIDADIESVSGSIYKITPKSIPADASGYMCLFVKMPAGSASRFYVVKLPH